MPWLLITKDILPGGHYVWTSSADDPQATTLAARISYIYDLIYLVGYDNYIACYPKSRVIGWGLVCVGWDSSLPLPLCY